MSTTRDWMRVFEDPITGEPKARPIRGALLWIALMALATFAALAVQKMIG